MSNDAYEEAYSQSRIKNFSKGKKEAYLNVDQNSRSSLGFSELQKFSKGHKFTRILICWVSWEVLENSSYLSCNMKVFKCKWYQ